MLFLFPKLVHKSFNGLVVVSATDDFLYVGTEDNGLEVELVTNQLSSQRRENVSDIHVRIEQCRSP